MKRSRVSSCSKLTYLANHLQKYNRTADVNRLRAYAALVAMGAVQELMDDVLKDLEPLERKVLIDRWCHLQHVEEVARWFRKTPDEIREIEAAAKKKLEQASVS